LNHDLSANKPTGLGGTGGRGVLAKANFSALAHDFDAEPLAKERLVRVRQALNQPFAMTPSKAALVLGDEKVFTLVHDPDGWRILSLE
jgi:hypothetical protein